MVGVGSLGIWASLLSDIVMPGLDPGIHVLSSIHKDVDGRVKPGHDEWWGTCNQLRGAEIGGGPRPTGFFGFSMPT